MVSSAKTKNTSIGYSFPVNKLIVLYENLPNENLYLFYYLN